MVLKYRQHYCRMSELITNFLKNQGLNDKDIAVYLDIFQHGQSFASSIGLRTKIDRTTVYSVLKRLLKHGFIVQSMVNDVAVYIATSPEVFLREIDQNIDELVSTKNLAEAFVSEMGKLMSQCFLRPKMRIYEGDKAIINLYEETLENPGNQKAFVNLCSISPTLKDFLRGKFIRSKVERHVFSKVLVADGHFSEKYKSLDNVSNRETKIVTSSPFDLQSEILLFDGEKVAIIDFNKPIYGIVFVSRTFYKTMDSIFDLIWEKVGNSIFRIGPG